MDRLTLVDEPLETHSDIAMGGNMTILGGKSMPGRASCEHSKTVAVISTGIERIVCESCGNVSFMFLDDMTDQIDRDMFARTVDREETEVALEASS